MDGERRALIVANDEYEHAGLRRLRAPAADAEALAGVLSDPAIGHFEVRAVHNEPAHEIQERIEELFSDARADDVLLLHFSCHGLKSEAGDLFFAARNTRPNRLGSTAVSAEFVQRCMRTSRSRSIVLLLDCCYGGAFGEGVSVRASGAVNVLDAFPGGRLGGGRGRAVITASSAMEYAFEGGDLADEHQERPSVFTSALVEGLRSGEADRDEDGLVSLNELYEYVFDRVREQNPNQTPSRDVEMQGELYLARSRRRRIAPLPVPADVRAAVADDNMYTRLGGVSELRARVNGDNVAAAMGAHTLLTEVAQGDIRYVADAAHAALRDVEPQVVEQRLDFGVVPLGDDVPARTLHVGGPPLARACTFEVSEPWLQARPTSEGAEVTVRPGVVGPLRGQVTVTAPTGQAVVEVRGEVVPRGEVAAEMAPAPVPVPAPVPAPVPVPVPTAAEAAVTVDPAGTPEPRAAAPSEAKESTDTTAHHASRDATPVVAGRVWPRLALLAGALLLASLFLPYHWGERLTELEGGFPWYLAASSTWLALGATAIAVGIAGATRSSSAWWGAEVLIGVVLLSVLGGVGALRSLSSSEGLEVGFWTALLGHLLLVAAAGVAMRDLLVAGVLGWKRPGAHWLTALYAALAVTGAAAMLGATADGQWSSYSFLQVPGLVLIAAAVAVPLSAAYLQPPLRALPVVAGGTLVTMFLAAQYHVMATGMGLSVWPVVALMVVVVATLCVALVVAGSRRSAVAADGDASAGGAIAR